MKKKKKPSKLDFVKLRARVILPPNKVIKDKRKYNRKVKHKKGVNDDIE